jgi:hypothetical protein
MAIEYHRHERDRAGTDVNVVMTACPFCLKPFRGQQSFAGHRPRCPNLTETGEVIPRDD